MENNELFDGSLDVSRIVEEEKKRKTQTLNIFDAKGGMRHRDKINIDPYRGAIIESV